MVFYNNSTGNDPGLVITQSEQKKEDYLIGFSRFSLVFIETSMNYFYNIMINEVS